MPNHGNGCHAHDRSLVQEGSQGNLRGSSGQTPPGSRTSRKCRPPVRSRSSWLKVGVGEEGGWENRKGCLTLEREVRPNVYDNKSGILAITISASNDSSAGNNSNDNMPIT